MDKNNNVKDFDMLKHGRGFKQYMKDKGYKSVSYSTECLWVQRYGKVKLNKEYERDCCESLLARLRNNGEFRRFVGIVKADADPNTNLSSYRSAVKKYVEFMDSLKYGDETHKKKGDFRKGTRHKVTSSPVKVSYLPGYGSTGKAAEATKESVTSQATMSTLCNQKH